MQSVSGLLMQITRCTTLRKIFAFEGGKGPKCHMARMGLRNLSAIWSSRYVQRDASLSP